MKSEKIILNRGIPLNLRLGWGELHNLHGVIPDSVLTKSPVSIVEK